MEINTYPLGPLGSNLYVINKNNHYLIIDPSVAPSRIGMDDKLENVEAVLITHGHFDHINKVDEWSVSPVYIHPNDFEAFKDPHVSLVSDFGLNDTYKTVPKDINEVNGKVFLGDDNDGVRISILHTPGHCPGQCCIFAQDLSTGQKVMFSGDMLFAGAIGRFDFNRSSAPDMKKSVDILKNLVDDYVVYPGHGPDTTLSEEKRSNPYFY